MNTGNQSSKGQIPEDKIRERAKLLSELRPDRTAECNWIDAQSELSKPAVTRWALGVWRWTGIVKKTGYEILVGLSIPFLIFTWQVSNASKQQSIADETQKDTVLRDYIAKMTELMLQRKLGSAKTYSEVSVVARTLTITSLSQLGAVESIAKSKRKGVITQFLVESQLIDRATPKVVLHGADFSKAVIELASDAKMVQLSQTNFNDAYVEGSFIMADLSSSSLVRATIYGANLEAAELVGANLEKAVLVATRLRGADLTAASLENARLIRFLPFLPGGYSHVDMRHACLERANLKGADLRGADLREANLREVEWNDNTRWPTKEYLEGATSIPAELQKRLGLNPNLSQLEGRADTSPNESCSGDAEKLYKYHARER